MRRHLVLLAVLLIGTTPALAYELPVRKAGLWQLTMSFMQPKLPSHVLRQCTDPSVDKLLNSMAVTAQQACSKREVHEAGDTITVDSVCAFAGTTSASHAVITGSFDSAYKMEVTVHHLSGPPLPGAGPDGTTHMQMAAKWLGPCGPGERPGDIIMANGMKVNVLDLLKKRKKPQQ